MSKFVLSSLAIVFFTSTAQATAVLIEDGKRKFGDKRSSVRHRVSAQDGIGLRDQRRVGIGLSTAGPVGILGLNLELNFSPVTSFEIGFGKGMGFNSFHIEARKMVSGTWFVPYIAGGYTRWMGTESGSLEETTPTFLGERFLSAEEKRTGKFVENIIYPALGIQYMQLKGDWVGTSIYAEVLLMIDMDDFVAAPTGEIGYIYYF